MPIEVPSIALLRSTRPYVPPSLARTSRRPGGAEVLLAPDDADALVTGGEPVRIEHVNAWVNRLISLSDPRMIVNTPSPLVMPQTVGARTASSRSSKYPSISTQVHPST